MRSSATGPMVLLLCVLLAIGAGAYVALRPTPEEIAQRVRHQQVMDAVAEARAEAILPLHLMITAAGAVLLLVVLGSVGMIGANALRDRACFVQADHNGLFPLVRIRVAGTVVIHDPNRQPVPVTVYAADSRGGVTVTPLVLPELLDATRAAVAQAATVQAIRAGVSSGPGLLPSHVQSVAQNLFPATDSVPTVRIIGEGATVPQIDRLLAAEAGDEADDA